MAKGKSIFSRDPENKNKRENKENGEKGRETPKIKEFACTVLNSTKLANWVSILMRRANWMSNSEISLACLFNFECCVVISPVGIG
jgi:hypothetical protein